MGDYDFIKEKHPYVKIIHNLAKGKSFNETQLKVFANCEHFITMNGGYSILAAYFGGKNIIYTKTTKEIRDCENSFIRWYPKLGGQDIRVTRNYKNLLNTIKYFYVDELPVVNVLMRTSNRANYFSNAINSVYAQDYPNIKILTSVEDSATNKYVTPYKCTPIFVNIEKRKGYKHFPYNLYFNEMYKYCKDGYVVHLDDDDEFINDSAISEAVKLNKDLVIWRLQYTKDRLIPSDKNMGKPPVECDIDTNNFMFKTKYLNLVKWDDMKRADFRVISHLYDMVENCSFIKNPFVKVQNVPGNGNRQDLIINENIKDMNYIVEFNKQIVSMPAADAVNISRQGKCKILKKEDKVKVNVTRAFRDRRNNYKVGENEMTLKLAMAVESSKLGKIIEDFEPRKEVIKTIEPVEHINT